MSGISVRLIDSRDSSEGIGDMSVATGYQWLSSERSSVAVWLNLKLPTGDADQFTGSGATDVALTIAGEHRLTDRWSMFGQVAGTWLGKGDTFGSAQNSVIWSGLAGVGVDVWRGLELKLQLDAHTAALNSDLDYLGSAGILTIGGAWHFKSGWQLDFGVSEDIVVDASPDVVFVVGIRREARAQRLSCTFNRALARSLRTPFAVLSVARTSCRRLPRRSTAQHRCWCAGASRVPPAHIRQSNDDWSNLPGQP